MCIDAYKQKQQKWLETILVTVILLARNGIIWT